MSKKVITKDYLKVAKVTLKIEYLDGPPTELVDFLPKRAIIYLIESINDWKNKYLFTVNDYEEILSQTSNHCHKIKRDAAITYNNNKEVPKKGSSSKSNKS